MPYQKKNILKLYNLPKKVKFCKSCTISNQRPRITFDKNGICSACNFNLYKKKIDWKKREEELLKLLDKFRSKTSGFDCLVPSSGGKDSGYVAHILKYKYEMNPLTITWAPNIWTDIGFKNYNGLVDSGISNILGKPNGEINKILTKLSFIHVGDPFQPFVYGQANFPLMMSVQYNIPLIFYGENGEVEYGGDLKNAHKPTKGLNDDKKHYFSNHPPKHCEKYQIKKKDLDFYNAPNIKKINKIGSEMHFFSYYHYWDPQENFYYCTKNTNFLPNLERSEGTYSKYASLDDQLDGFHYYLMYIKFGIGRATSDSAHEIRDEKISREEGVSLVKKYDGEFPKKYFKVFLKYIDMNENEFWNIINSWRSDHIWKKEKKNYKLRTIIS